MHRQSYQHHNSPLGIIILIFLMCGFGLYIILGLRDSEQIYIATSQELNKPVYSGSLAKVEFTGATGTLNIPSWKLFQQGQLWTLVSHADPLVVSYIPDNLINLTLPHGDSASVMKAQSMIIPELTALFNAAEAAGHPLMMSSAYRSIDEQKKLYDFFVLNHGQSSADMYVAQPGESEHNTGLAVDLSNVSASCRQDSDKCSLDLVTTAWLSQHAYNYGFIQRYPEGKRPITGISYEPWHYRYVGIALASKIQVSSLTLDEALTQMHPAFAK